MSKYIVDTDDFEPMFKVDLIGVFGVGESVIDSTENHSWSRIKSLEDFDELNSDYINEHFGQLQDEAYKRGFEDGKWKSEDGCTGCQYEGKVVTGPPCITCCNSYINQWTAKKQDDEIKVGDIVERYINGKLDSTGIYLGEDGGYWSCLFWTGTVFGTFAYPKNQFKKTGRHVDITDMLKGALE